MIRVYDERSALHVIVEIPELASRFRETPQAVKDALLLLSEMGRAEPFHRRGCWKVRLAGTLRRDREDVGAA